LAVDFLHDVAGEHEGYLMEAFARYWHPVSKMFDFGLGGGFRGIFRKIKEVRKLMVGYLTLEAPYMSAMGGFLETGKT